MLTEYERSDRRRSALGCGVTLLVIGLLMALLGCFWHFQPLTEATGIIVESRRLAAPTSHIIVYEYDVSGVRYRGERFLRYLPRYDGFYVVGSPFHIYFVTAHPEVSYGPNRPVSWRILFFGVLVALMSALFFIPAWQTRNT